MLRAFRLSVGQLGDPAIIRVIVRSLALTLLVFAVLAAVGGWALTGIDPCAVLDAEDSCPLGGGAGGIGAVLLFLAGVWFLFPAVAIGVVCAFMDDVVRAVEARHYPAALAQARPLGWSGAAWLGLRSSLRVTLYNLVALPLYVVLLVTGIGTVIAFVAVNGLAFGRDLGDTVARRHLPAGPRRDWLRSTRGSRAFLGMVVTALFLVPFVNLVAPVLGASMATHLFHARQRASAKPGY